MRVYDFGLQFQLLFPGHCVSENTEPYQTAPLIRLLLREQRLLLREQFDLGPKGLLYRLTKYFSR